jgi:hypothetical protein
MTTNITTLTQKIIGRGHVMEDENPIPTRFRESMRPQPDDEKVDSKKDKTIKPKGE